MAFSSQIDTNSPVAPPLSEEEIDILSEPFLTCGNLINIRTVLDKPGTIQSLTEYLSLNKNIIADKNSPLDNLKKRYFLGLEQSLSVLKTYESKFKSESEWRKPEFFAQLYIDTIMAKNALYKQNAANLSENQQSLLKLSLKNYVDDLSEFIGKQKFNFPQFHKKSEKEIFTKKMQAITTCLGPISALMPAQHVPSFVVNITESRTYSFTPSPSVFGGVKITRADNGFSEEFILPKIQNIKLSANFCSAPVNVGRGWTQVGNIEIHETGWINCENGPQNIDDLILTGRQFEMVGNERDGQAVRLKLKYCEGLPGQVIVEKILGKQSIYAYDK